MTAEPLYSEFADDPEMRPLLEMFADGLAETCTEVRRALVEGDVDTLRRLGHQLKGSGGGYGYPALTGAGRDLEDAVTAAGAVDEAVRAAAEELSILCHQVRAGMGP